MATKNALAAAATVALLLVAGWGTMAIYKGGSVETDFYGIRLRIEGLQR